MHYFLASTDSTNIYSSNSWCDFTVDITPPIYLHKALGWKLALLQLDVTQELNNTKGQLEEEAVGEKIDPTPHSSKYIYVHCDLISSNNNVLGSGSSVIQYFPIITSPITNSINFSPNIPYYFPINSNVLSSIRIYLKDEFGNTPSLRGVDSRCSLHFT